MRFRPTLPLSVIPPDRLTISIAAMSPAAIDHASVVSKIHDAALAALPDASNGVAREFDIEVHFDFAPFLTAPLIGRLRLSILFENESVDVAADFAAVLDYEIDRAIREYGLTRVIADAELMRAEIYALRLWDGALSISAIKALRDIEILAVKYGADPADVVAYLLAAEWLAFGETVAIDNDGQLAPGPTSAFRTETVILEWAA